MYRYSLNHIDELLMTTVTILEQQWQKVFTKIKESIELTFYL
jgi:hypothetical protein